MFAVGIVEAQLRVVEAACIAGASLEVEGIVDASFELGCKPVAIARLLDAPANDVASDLDTTSGIGIAGKVIFNRIADVADADGIGAGAVAKCRGLQVEGSVRVRRVFDTGVASGAAVVVLG